MAAALLQACGEDSRCRRTLLASGWFWSCWVKQNASVEIFQAFGARSLQVSGDVSMAWVPGGHSLGRQQAGSPVRRSCAQPRLWLWGFLSGRWWPAAALPSHSADAVRALRQRCRCQSRLTGSVVPAWFPVSVWELLLKESKPPALLSWLCGTENSEERGVNPLSAWQLRDSPRRTGSTYCAPTFPWGVAVEDAGVACDLALCL